MLETLIDRPHYQPLHGSWISQHLVPGNSQDLVPLVGQESITALIMLSAFIRMMMLTIDLDD